MSLLLTRYDAHITNGAGFVTVGNVLVCIPTPQEIEDYGPEITCILREGDKEVPLEAVLPLIKEIATLEGWDWLVRRCDEEMGYCPTCDQVGGYCGQCSGAHWS
jgi:hypothetical protein